MHRDIKAQNVLLTRDGAVKLADFGIARLIESEDGEGLTRTDMLLGSADYLSPEQADGRPVDARADVYSLGILLYECLTGGLPFRGEGFVAVAMKHCSEPLPDPRLARHGVPDHLAAVAMRAAAKEPADRFPDAEAMVAALEGRRGRHRRLRHAAAARRGRGRHRPPPAPPGPPAWPSWSLLLLLVVAGAVGGLRARSSRSAAAARRPRPRRCRSRSRRCATTTPQGDDKEEQPALRGLAIDVDANGRPNPATAWYTERYRDSPAFGGSGKTGVGLIAAADRAGRRDRDGGQLADAGRDLPGARAAGGRGRARSSAQGTFGTGEQVVKLATAAPAEAYVLWITSLVSDGEDGYWAGVGQVELRGTPNQD